MDCFHSIPDAPDVPDEADVADDPEKGKKGKKEKIFKTSDDVAFYRYVEHDLLRPHVDAHCLISLFIVTFEATDAGSKLAAPGPAGHHGGHRERGMCSAVGV